jgi:hypothetical protein
MVLTALHDGRVAFYMITAALIDKDSVHIVRTNYDEMISLMENWNYNPST